MTINDIINYWYSERMQKHWFSSTPELDQEILQTYEHIWQIAASGELDNWQESPEGCLALIIILDQFPLNMFRGLAKSFQTEAKAIVIAKNAVNRGFEQLLSTDKLAFLFMPLMHSENIADQDLSMLLYKQFNLKHNLGFAQHHRELIMKFGRFPHRNHILGRESTELEKAYLLSDEAFKG